MPDFNTFPSANVDGGGSGGGSSSVSGSLGMFPLIPPIYPSRTASTIASNVEGIIGDGDYIKLPASATDVLTYSDSSGAILFTAANNTGVDAASEGWTNFLLDPVDNLLYILSANKTTNTFYFSSIDSTGTLVNIGNFSATAVDTWANWLVSSMTRAADGSGDFELIGSQHRVTFTVGAVLVSETVGNVTGLDAPSFKTSFDDIRIKFTKTLPTAANAYGIELINLLINTPSTASPETKKRTQLVAPAMLMGLPTGQSHVSLTFTPLQWRGITVLWHSTATFAVMNYNRAGFLLAMDTIITNFNLNDGEEF